MEAQCNQKAEAIVKLLDENEESERKREEMILTYSEEKK